MAFVNCNGSLYFQFVVKTVFADLNNLVFTKKRQMKKNYRTSRFVLAIAHMQLNSSEIAIAPSEFCVLSQIAFVPYLLQENSHTFCIQACILPPRRGKSNPNLCASYANPETAKSVWSAKIRVLWHVYWGAYEYLQLFKCATRYWLFGRHLKLLPSTRSNADNFYRSGFF